MNDGAKSCYVELSQRALSSDMVTSKPFVVFVYPLVWAPLKPNFAMAFELLSSRFRGLVCLSSAEVHRGTPVGGFQMHASRNTGGTVSWVRRFVVQAVTPILQSRTEKISVVQAYDPYACGLAACLVARATGARLIVEMNGDHHERVSPRWSIKAPLMRMVMEGVLARADAIRVLNRSQERYARAVYPAARVYRFPDFVSYSTFANALARDDRYLLFVGYPFHLKGLDILIAAFQAVRDEFPDVSLRVMGHASAAELSHYRRLANGDERVVFVPPGWVEDVVREMSACTALVNPSRTEAMGRVHLEAMATGKPVIASRTNGAIDVVAEGVTGLLFDIDDVDGLAAAIRRILCNPDEASRMGANGRVAAAQLFTEEWYVANVGAMIDDVIRPAAAREYAPGR